MLPAIGVWLTVTGKAVHSPPPRTSKGAGLSGEIVVWDVRRRTLERIIMQPDLIGSIRFSPDGTRIATGDSTGDVEFWDPASGRQVGRTLSAHNGWVGSVTYEPSGSHVVTTSTDGRLRLWDVASGKLAGSPLPGADEGRWGTVFPDGKHAIAVFPSGTGVVWTIDPAAWRAQACRIAHRNMTRAEWRDFLPRARSPAPAAELRGAEAGGGTRTHGLRITSALLYQLSYSGLPAS